LAEKFGKPSMEGAAERALFFGNTDYRSLKIILEKGWSLQIEPSSKGMPLSSLGQRFLRPSGYFTYPDRKEAL
jgi:hypothetical protein